MQMRYKIVDTDNCWKQIKKHMITNKLICCWHIWPQIQITRTLRASPYCSSSWAESARKMNMSSIKEVKWWISLKTLRIMFYFVQIEQKLIIKKKHIKHYLMSWLAGMLQEPCCTIWYSGLLCAGSWDQYREYCKTNVEYDKFSAASTAAATSVATGVHNCDIDTKMSSQYSVNAATYLELAPSPKRPNFACDFVQPAVA